MSTPFGLFARRGLGEALAAAVAEGDTVTDFRTALCAFEDDLFASFPEGHGLLDLPAAQAMVGEVFAALDRRPPRLALVPGFADPRVGGYADVANHRIAIERGHLYRFLVLHESAHLIVPEDRRHGPGFTFVLQLLYRSFIGIPDEAIRQFLRRHRLPSHMGVPERRVAA
jgi:3',5'-cyclic AMP phosphodiesterase CpdA